MCDEASSSFGEKIRLIREAEEMGRQEFSDVTGIPKNTLIRLEQGKNEPSAKVLSQVCRSFERYTTWLMTDQVNEIAGQVSPEMERARKELKPTGTDTD
ncbi:helix-turn-helix domain-containing protein [Halomonas sp. PBN3]|uniref:helix-turn-helix domain-containing protein n=1 Tax=Halomonas sp. PBN3 TaxID=1397528 RepID=UPI0003B89D84|nr:helix-turn-helix transcriptional regulator [Halomonas sp. PBN3]ERS91941.1 XRE family transcriptional regulator [Halomonas sp. PBN3]